MTAAEIEQLEQAIVSYKYYDERGGKLSAEDKRAYIRWNRAHRLRLLGAIPKDLCSPRVRRLLQEEERALPGLPDWDVGPVEVSWVGSPMDAEQMSRASDDQILNFFEKIGKVKRGNTDASLVFSQFAKKQPNRAIGLFGRFEPEKHGLAAAPARRELATVDTVEPERLIGLIHGLAVNRRPSLTPDRRAKLTPEGGPAVVRA